MKEIMIGDYKYEIQYSPEVADAVLNKIIEWMGKHSASSHGEGIMQDDNCQIYAPELIADIVDDILKPKCLDDE